ncbi:MAG: hypothetical protein CMK36_04955 [Porticoccaceae bacterium]|nr:hypothetical protein [Porticoccaceae bacterium]
MFNCFIRVACSLLLLITYCSADDAAQLLPYLEQLEGRWVGHYTIHTSINQYKEEFTVEQQYWMQDGELLGVFAAMRSKGLESASSRTFIQDGRLILIVSRSSGEETYIGVLAEDWLIWLPEDVERANQYQIREKIVRHAGGYQLISESFETYETKNGPAKIRISGSLLLSTN